MIMEPYNFHVSLDENYYDNISQFVVLTVPHHNLYHSHGACLRSLSMAHLSCHFPILASKPIRLP